MSCGSPPRTTSETSENTARRSSDSGHGVQEAAQAVDPLASERLAIDDRGMFERDAEQIDDAVEERLVFVGEGVVLRRGDPHRAVHARPLARGAENPRTVVGFVGIDRHARAVDPAARDRHVALA